MSAPDIVLHQFQFSHFNEKARWALAYKGIDHERISYLPGPHAPRVNRLSGQTQTPVLEIDDEIVVGSAAIIDRLEWLQPDPPLYPVDPDQRQRAAELQARFDAQVGPATRTALFSVLLDEGGYIAAMFARDRTPLARACYRATLPLAKGLIARRNGTTDPANVTRAFEITRRTLDEVAEQVAATGYLVGESFSVADLTAASLLSPIANPRHPDMARPEPIPARVAGLLAEYRDHPAITWVNEMYSKHRPE